MAAALAFYSVFALPSLLVIIISLCALFLEPSIIQGRIENEITSVVGQEGAKLIRNMLREDLFKQEASFAKLVGLITLFIGATGVVTELQFALNTTWNVKPNPKRSVLRNFFIKRLLSVAMILGIAFLLLVSLLLSTLITVLNEHWTNWLPMGVSETALVLINIGSSLFIFTVLFALMFKYIPDAKIAWKDVITGSIITAVLFIIGKSITGIYLGSRNIDSTYGAAGSLALILLWIYYTSSIFLFGAEFTQVLATREGKRIAPEKGAVEVLEIVEKTKDPEELSIKKSKIGGKEVKQA